MENSEKQAPIQNRSLRFNFVVEHEWVQVLINLRMKYAKSFSGKRNSATSAWNNIVQEMYELGAPKSITRLRIKKKWMNLIAKYKQLKADVNTKKQNAWPYFEQIDRAYSKKGIEGTDTCDIFVKPSTSTVLTEDSKELLAKELFVRTLICLRYKHRNLFTGKKYAAQKSWMLIQNYLPSGEKYSITQISKLWHNLVQNYKSLIEKEPDHSKITWVYFQQLHSIMLQKKDGEGATTIEFVDEHFPIVNGTNEQILENSENLFQNVASDANEDKTDFEDWEMEVAEPTENLKDTESINTEHDSKSKINLNQTTTSLTDILNYMKERDQKRDQQLEEIFKIMQDILYHLKQ